MKHDEPVVIVDVVGQRIEAVADAVVGVLVALFLVGLDEEQLLHRKLRLETLHNR